MFVLITPMEKILSKICMKNNTLSYLLFRCRKKFTRLQLARAKNEKSEINLLFILHSLIIFNEYSYVSIFSFVFAVVVSISLIWWFRCLHSTEKREKKLFGWLRSVDEQHFKGEYNFKRAIYHKSNEFIACILFLYLSLSRPLWLAHGCCLLNAFGMSIQKV